MTEFTCEICQQQAETPDPRQCHTAWNEILYSWELICDDCADKS